MLSKLKELLINVSGADLADSPLKKVVKQSCLKALLMMGLLICSTLATAATPIFVVNKALSLGVLYFNPANCQMDATTGEVSGQTLADSCEAAEDTSFLGRYVIIANPNKIVRFRMISATDGDTGVTFVPDGRLVSAAGTINFIANATAQINTGATGVVHIYVGGKFYLTQQLAPGASYSFDVANGIEWSELP